MAMVHNFCNFPMTFAEILILMPLFLSGMLFGSRWRQKCLRPFLWELRSSHLCQHKPFAQLTALLSWRSQGPR